MSTHTKPLPGHLDPNMKPVSFEQAVEEFKTAWKVAEEQKCGVVACVFQRSEENVNCTGVISSPGGPLLAAILKLAEIAADQIPVAPTRDAVALLRYEYGEGINRFLESLERRGEKK